jgi:hypothetical protein
VTGVTTVLALITFTGEQKLLAEGAQDWLIELTLNELVAVHLKDIALALSDSALTSETTVTGF